MPLPPPPPPPPKPAPSPVPGQQQMMLVSPGMQAMVPAGGVMMGFPVAVSPGTQYPMAAFGGGAPLYQPAQSAPGAALPGAAEPLPTVHDLEAEAAGK
ncbi:forkhead box protein E3-like [Pollicipes pollicipes]|uniref:forkhead box protein E3-like n=1 Tax=Pollicipes pollicipes TaxID=41117 RepID=UPI0018853172|nr:forkhead box protein E3-like [Pollicipes pollicipes]